MKLANGKVNSSSDKIINAFNSGLAKIKADGAYDQILKKYGVE